MQEPPVRRLEESDLGDVKRLIDSTALFPSELLDGMAAGYLDGASDERWWVYDEGRAVGVAYCCPERLTDATWNMLLLAVHSAEQGRGVGRRLVAAIESELASAGARLLIVETSGLPEFAATRRFYAGAGYEQEARIREFYRAGDDKVVFRKLLGRRERP
jgi:ribosomal protein S18 acetylase RimI-like enzyme